MPNVFSVDVVLFVFECEKKTNEVKIGLRLKIKWQNHRVDNYKLMCLYLFLEHFHYTIEQILFEVFHNATVID